MKTRLKNAVLWWAAAAFVLQLAAWTFLFIIAAHHRVPETPLARSMGGH